MSEAGRVLLVANNFPPVRGGSAVVYDSLARFAAGRLVVVAARLHYADGLPLIGWREHDRHAPYRVRRLALLRTVIQPEPLRARWRRAGFLFADIAIRLRLALALLWWVWRERAGAVCLGELVASSWVIHLFRFVPWVRVVVYVHGEEITTADPYDPGGVRRRRALLAADAVVVVSRFTLVAVHALLAGARVQKRGRLPDIRLIENGVDTARFRPLGRSADLAALYGLDGCFVFVAVCRLLEKKGLDQALRAFAVVGAAHPHCRFLIVGGGPYRPTLEAIAGELGVTPRVVFAGEVAEAELVSFYCLGDVFVMPNRELPNGDTEGFGLVFLEANACGLPVIAGSDGGSIDAVRDGINGLLVDGHSVDAIAEAMLALRRDPPLYDRLRAGGLDAAAAADWRHKARAFVALFDTP